MKKFSKRIMFCVAMVLALTVGLVACAPPAPVESGDVTKLIYDPTGMTEVDDLTSGELLRNVITTWEGDDAYKMDMTLHFECDGAGINFATQQKKKETIKNGSGFYELELITGTGQGKPELTAAAIHYDGTIASTFEIEYSKDNKSKVWYDEDAKEIKSDLGTPSYSAFGGDLAAKTEDAIGSITSYLTDEKYINAIDNENRVFTKDNKVYATVTMDSVNYTEENRQLAVEKSIKEATGGEFKEFRQDTLFVIEAELVDGEYRMLQLVCAEYFNGKLGIELNCTNMYTYAFSYDVESVKLPTIA